MPRTKTLLYIFVPALCILVLVLAIRVAQFRSLYVTPDNSVEQKETFIPIFGDDPIFGNKRAPITLVAFEDFGCKSCEEQYPIIRELVARHDKQVKIVWKPVSVTRFPISTQRANQFALCAAKQKQFMAFADMAFANYTNLTEATLHKIAETIDLDSKKLASCLDDPSTLHNLQQNEILTQQLGLQTAPTIFLNNTQVPSLLSVEAWEQALEL